MTPTFKSLIAFTCLMLLSSCATNEMTGRSQLRIFPEEFVISKMTESYNARISIYDNSSRLIKSGAEVDRVRLIANKLIEQAVLYKPGAAFWDWEVNLVENSADNANCMAGGKIVVYTGIIKNNNLTDDELAQVLGHEISHALAGHSAEKMSIRLVQNIVVKTVEARAKGKVSRDDLSNLADLLIGLPYSRDAENEADKLGIELAARAGYDPQAAVTFWDKIDRRSSSYSSPEFLSTHPSHETRISNLRTLQSPMKRILDNSKHAGGPVKKWTESKGEVRFFADIVSSNDRLAYASNIVAITSPRKFYSGHSDENAAVIELSCATCQGQFERSQHDLSRLYLDKKWTELTTEVVKIGFPLDLAYFYLGAAADGSGEKPAAALYYQKASTLGATTNYACKNLTNISCSMMEAK